MRYEIDFTRLIHREGSKEYAIDFIEREDGAVLLIFQWGKVGTKGQLQSHFFKSGEKKRARAMREKKIQNKKARGYADDLKYVEYPHQIDNQQELLRLYRASFDDGWWFRIPENHRKLITDDYSEATNELTLLNSQAEQVDMAAIYANHPLYGRF